MWPTESTERRWVGMWPLLFGSAKIRRYGAITLAGCLWLCVVAVAHEPAAPPMRVWIETPVRVEALHVYRVHVLAAGAPILILAPLQTQLARLEVNGAVVQQTGNTASFAGQPLGHSVTTLQLTDLTPRDKIRVITVGASAAADDLRVASDVTMITTAAQIGMTTGIYFAFLALIALFHVVHGITQHQRTNFWYAGWALAILLIEIVNDGYFGITGVAVGALALAATFIVICVVGFVITYLRLASDAPRLIWLVVGANAISLIVAVLVGSDSGSRHYELLMGSRIVGCLSLVITAIVRWRAGFMPAGVLAGGLILLSTAFALKLVLNELGSGPPLLWQWGSQCATICDFTLFAIALSVRSRYAKFERAALEARLRDSVFEATHDALTGLLNRRGLEQWLDSATDLVATVFFIDLDGFKAINDRGGHDAGDAVLRVVSRIITHAVREQDAVVRIGGDEFVVAFSGETSPIEIADVRKRISTAVSALEPLGPRDQTRIGASIGIGTVGPDVSIDDALRTADADVYRVKLDHYARRRDLAVRG